MLCRSIRHSSWPDRYACNNKVVSIGTMFLYEQVCRFVDDRSSTISVSFNNNNRSAMETTLIYPKAILGIDVSKSKLDCHFVPDESAVIPARRRVRSSVKAYRRTVSNTEAGVRKLQEWMKSKGVEQAHVCLEPTSTYHELAFELLSVDHCVS